ncbi:hypothetical protein ACIHAA_31205 [Streptomyces sp. NPDC052040]|uniref:hypothetical protein n=1 Tax=unclassified Streptomyces TaxID=2593676 RepID=UPI0037CEBA67
MKASPRWRVALASAASAALLVAAPLVEAPAAHAQPSTPCPTYPPVARLTLSRVLVPAGGSLTFSGTCFAPHETVVVQLRPRGAVLDTVRADRLGVARGRVTIPWRTDRGNHLVELRGLRSHRTLTALIRVIGR